VFFSFELLHDLELTLKYTGDYLARKPHLALVSWAVVSLGGQILMQALRCGVQRATVDGDSCTLNCLSTVYDMFLRYS
jgi:hypothetical protein